MYGSCPTPCAPSRGFLTLFGEYNKYVLRRLGGVARHLMAAASRSLLFALLFYPGTLLFVLDGDRRRRRSARAPMLRVVYGWAHFHHWLAA